MNRLNVVFLMFIFVLSFGFSYAYDCSDTGTSLVSEIECDALVRLYNELDGPSWTDNTNWLVIGQSVNDWYGVSVISGYLNTISLASNGLSGGISSWSGLSGVDNIILNDNNISFLPSSWGLNKISRLNLYNNNISTIPLSWSGLTITGWKNLYLYSNNISSIPDTWEGLDNGGVILLYDNSLTSIPSSWAGLLGIFTIALNHNSIGGKIPLVGIENLSGSLIYINNNKFYGDIPSYFINLAGRYIDRNYLNTYNVIDPLLSHLNSNFNYNNYEWIIQYPIMTIDYGGQLFNHISPWAAGIYLNVELDCRSVVRNNASTIYPGGYRSHVDMFCGDSISETGTIINIKKFK